MLLLENFERFNSRRELILGMFSIDEFISLRPQPPLIWRNVGVLEQLMHALWSFVLVSQFKPVDSLKGASARDM